MSTAVWSTGASTSVMNARVLLSLDFSLRGVMRKVIGHKDSAHETTNQHGETPQWAPQNWAQTNHSSITENAPGTTTPVEFDVDELLSASSSLSLEMFDAEDRVRMQKDLTSALMSAMATGDWTHYNDTLYAWQTTAEVLSDPDLTAELLSDDDPSDEVSLRRP